MFSQLADHYAPFLDIFNKIYETNAQVVRSQWMPPGTQTFYQVAAGSTIPQSCGSLQVCASLVYYFAAPETEW